MNQKRVIKNENEKFLKENVPIQNLHVQKNLGMINCNSCASKLQTFWYFVTKIILTYREKNCSSDREKLLRSLEQFIQKSESSEEFLVT